MKKVNVSERYDKGTAKALCVHVMRDIVLWLSQETLWLHNLCNSGHEASHLYRGFMAFL